MVNKPDNSSRHPRRLGFRVDLVRLLAGVSSRSLLTLYPRGLARSTIVSGTFPPGALSNVLRARHGGIKKEMACDVVTKSVCGQ